MVRAIDANLIIENGTATFKMKSYPDWYGIPDVGFISHNTWADPEIEYNGKQINSEAIQDTMWERWIHDNNGNVIPQRESDWNGFAVYMKENADEVKELIELSISGE